MSEPSWDWHCSDLAAEHIRKVTGRDIWAELGGAPRNTKQASELFKRLHVRTYKNAVSKVLGKPIDPKLAMRGDIVMVDNALGICRGDLIECMDRTQPMGRAQCAWRL